jgi:AraC-like DNA-binding protein
MAVLRARSGHEWADLSTASFVPLRVASTAAAFVASIDQRSVGGARISLIRSDPCHVVRTGDLIRSSEDDDVLFSVQLRGTNTVEQHGRTARVRRGEGVLYLTGAPYDLRFPDAGCELVLQVPRRDVGVSRQALGPVAARTLSNAGSPALRTYIAFVLSAMRGEPWVEDDDQFARTATELLAGVLHHASDSGDLRRHLSPQALLASLQQQVADQLEDPRLDVAALARRHGVSVRTVHAAFAAAGETPAEYVRGCRVRRAQDLLNRTSLPLVDVATMSGFADQTTFQRAVKRVTGCTPMALRREVR